MCRSNSYLNNIYDLNNLDWNNILENSLTSLVKQVCELWNQGFLTTDIVKEMSISRGIITDYLNLGTSVGICNYDNKLRQRYLCLTTKQIFRSINEGKKYYSMPMASEFDNNKIIIKKGKEWTLFNPRIYNINDYNRINN